MEHDIATSSNMSGLSSEGSLDIIRGNARLSFKAAEHFKTQELGMGRDEHISATVEVLSLARHRKEKEKEKTYR